MATPTLDEAIGKDGGEEANKVQLCVQRRGTD
jgi:hypothetical protein